MIKDVPVLVIAGEEDRQFAVHTCRKMAKTILDSKFVVLPGTAIWLPAQIRRW